MAPTAEAGCRRFTRGRLARIGVAGAILGDLRSAGSAAAALLRPKPRSDGTTLWQELQQLDGQIRAADEKIQQFRRNSGD